MGMGGRTAVTGSRTRILNGWIPILMDSVTIQPVIDLIRALT
jgi:hypothetical protein